MSKKFVLIATYGTGQVAVEVSSPDLVEAINEFNEVVDNVYGGKSDKSVMRPQLLKAEILPLMKKSIYAND